MREFRIAVVISLILVGVIFNHSAALYLSLDFALDNQTYSWADSLLVDHRLNKSTVFQLWNRSTATLIKKSVLGGGEDRWQKLARSSADITRRLSTRVSVGLEFKQDFERLEKDGSLAAALSSLPTSVWEKSNCYKEEE